MIILQHFPSLVESAMNSGHSFTGTQEAANENEKIFYDIFSHLLHNIL